MKQQFTQPGAAHLLAHFTRQDHPSNALSCFGHRNRHNCTSSFREPKCLSAQGPQSFNEFRICQPMPMPTRDMVEDSPNYLENTRACLEELLLPKSEETGGERELSFTTANASVSSLFLHSLHNFFLS